MQAKIHRASRLAASLTVLLVGASFYAQNVRVEPRDQQAPHQAGDHTRTASAVESAASRR